MRRNVGASPNLAKDILDGNNSIVFRIAHPFSTGVKMRRL